MKIEPLRLSSSIPSKPSWMERLCRLVPLAGWVIANELEKRRKSPELSSLAQQLASRSKQEANAYTRDDSHARVSAFVAETVRDSFGWPNDYFIADDPLDLMLFGDEGAGIEVINAIEDYLDLPRGTISNEQIDNSSKMMFGQFIDFVISISNRSVDSKP